MGGSGGSGGGGGLAGAGGADDGAECMSEAPRECPERCPSFDTCFLAGGMGQPARLYYRVEGQRFDCDGLDCVAAAEQMADFCCQRGAFAPDDDDDDGGCALPGGAASGSSGAWLGVVLGIGLLGLGRRRLR